MIENVNLEIRNNRDDQKVTNTKKLILLDLQSTVDIFCDVRFLKSIQRTENHIILKTNTCSSKVDQQGYSEVNGWVWFYGKVLTKNIFLNN